MLAVESSHFLTIKQVITGNNIITNGIKKKNNKNAARKNVCATARL